MVKAFCYIQWTLYWLADRAVTDVETCPETALLMLFYNKPDLHWLLK